MLSVKELMPSNCGAGKDLLKSSLDSNEIKLVNPKGKQPWTSLQGLMLKLKRQYFGHRMRRAYSLEKTLMLRKIEGRTGRGQQRMRWLVGIISLTGKLGVHAKSWMGLSDWTANSQTILWILHYTTYVLSTFFLRLNLPNISFCHFYKNVSNQI